MPLKFANNQSLTSTTALPASVPTDNLILISTQTASNSSSISFTSGLDSTYDMYEFHFINLHPSSTGGVKPTFQLSTNGGSTYAVTMTTTVFRALHSENDASANLSYDTGNDQAQGTSFQMFSTDIGEGNDENSSGILELYNPSSTTYVKHFIARSNGVNTGAFSLDTFVAGYANTTSAINAIQFKFASGNIDDGIIKLYGVKKS